MNRNGNLYQQMQNEHQVVGASSYQLIKMLFDRCQQHLVQAQTTLTATTQTCSCLSIVNAINIIEYLRSCLSRSDEKTTKLADQLDDLYKYSIRELTNAYNTNNLTSLNDAFKVIEIIKSSWDLIESKVTK